MAVLLWPFEDAAQDGSSAQDIKAKVDWSSGKADLGPTPGINKVDEINLILQMLKTWVSALTPLMEMNC